MQPDSTKIEQAVRRPERRRHLRLEVDEPVSLLQIHPYSAISGRLIDLGQHGCCVRTELRFLAGVMIRVEVVFKIRGESFRIPGVTQWTDRKQTVGIRFIDMTERRMTALAEILAEVEANHSSLPAKAFRGNDPAGTS